MHTPPKKGRKPFVFYLFPHLPFFVFLFFPYSFFASAPVLPPVSFEESPNFPRKLSLHDGKSYFGDSGQNSSKKATRDDYSNRVTARSKQGPRGDYGDGSVLSEQMHPSAKTILDSDRRISPSEHFKNVDSGVRFRAIWTGIAKKI